MGLLYFATKRTGEQTSERLRDVHVVKDDFVPRFVALCVHIDKEDALKKKITCKNDTFCLYKQTNAAGF